MNDAMQTLIAKLVSVMTCLREYGVDATIIGGIAVHLLTMSEDDGNDRYSLLDVSALDEAHLAFIGRVTQDIDIGVACGQFEDAKQALTDYGMYEDERRTYRLYGHGTWVDLLEIPSNEIKLDEQHALNDAAAPGLGLITDGGCVVKVGETFVPVAQPAAIVVLKALAWCDRHEPRDLVDVARLAFLDMQKTTQTSAALGALVPQMSDRVLQAIDRLRDAFRSSDAPGPGHFAMLVRDQVICSDERWFDAEDRLRAMISGAVIRLLGEVPPLR